MRPLTPFLLTALPSVSAWGSLGHETVAYLAQNYISDSTATWAQTILSDSSSSYLANISTWADSYRYTAEGTFSAPYHYIDAEDDPPSSCNVDYDRDCGSGGCVVSAIANYTARVTDTGLDDTERNDALRFIVHFVGDIHQPLHDEAYALGGNDVDVTYDNESTNLHAIWDTQILEQLRGGYGLSYAADWAKNLSAEIDGGIYAGQKETWTEGLDVGDAKDTALSWASEANSYVCSVVAPDGWDAVETGDLSGAYYDGVVDTVELQIARAGVRLAAFLDAIAASQSSEKRNVVGKERRGLEMNLLPPARPLSKAKLARAAVGYGCKH